MVTWCHARCHAAHSTPVHRFTRTHSVHHHLSDREHYECTRTPCAGGTGSNVLRVHEASERLPNHQLPRTLFQPTRISGSLPFSLSVRRRFPWTEPWNKHSQSFACLPARKRRAGEGALRVALRQKSSSRLLAISCRAAPV